MLPPLASVQELAESIEETIAGTAVKRAEYVLNLASALVRTETRQPWTETGGDLATDIPDNVLLVTLAAAGRGYTNPDANVSESIDDGQVTRVVAEAGVYLTATEKTLLAAHVAGSRGPIWSMNTAPGGDLQPPAWIINGPGA